MRVLTVFSLALLLAGCLSGTQVNNSGFGRYSNSTASYAARGGEMPLVVFGNPTNAPQAAVDQAVADGLYGTHVLHRTVFVPRASLAPEGYRTVVHFGGIDGDVACGLDAQPTNTANPGPVTAAFCLNDEALSYAAGKMAAVSGPDDPLLKKQMTALGLEIFPPVNPNYIGGDCGPMTGFC